MQTRTLLLMSRRNPQQAERLLQETRRIIGEHYWPASSGKSNDSIATILANLSSVVATTPLSPRIDHVRSSEYATASHTLSACLEDVDNLLEGVQGPLQSFDAYRNFAGQSGIILRDQKAWTGRTATERLFWRSDYSLWLSQVSTLPA
jgi:hypothetical protein